MPKISLRNEIASRLKDGGNMTPLKDKYIHQRAAELYDSKEWTSAGRLLSRLEMAAEIERRGLGFMTMGVDARGRQLASRITMAHSQWIVNGYSSSVMPQGMNLVMMPADYEFVKDISMAELIPLIDFMAEVDEASVVWGGDDWNAYLTECRKKNMTGQMAETAIEALVKSRLKGTGIRYYIETMAVQTRIVFLVAHNQQMEFAFATSAFRDNVDKAVETAIRINNIVTEIGKPIKLTRCSVIDLQSSKWIDS